MVFAPLINIFYISTSNNMGVNNIYAKNGSKLVSDLR